MIIDDGKGKGYKVEVKPNNKLATESVSIPRAAYIADADENSYLLATGGFLNLTTTGSENAIFYFKYTGEGHLHIDNIRMCGTSSQKWLVYKNPTGGTIISDAVAANVNNTNLTSSNTVSADVYKGGNGKTLTGGAVIENLISNHHSVEDFDGTLILGKGDSIGITCEVGVTSDVCVRVTCFIDGGKVL